RLLNVLTIIVAVGLGVATAILSAVGLISTVSTVILVTILLAATAVIALIGLIALFFPCSLKCKFTRDAICRYSGRIAFGVASVIVIGLIIVALSLFDTAIATPILLGLLVLLFAYLAGVILQFSYVTVDNLCDEETSEVQPVKEAKE
ncbi:MAG: hypothetical protein IJO19_00750, partial [Clostridia bacterium]|nr:hypothetical protein [Clostridia bacterium]